MSHAVVESGLVLEWLGEVRGVTESPAERVPRVQKAQGRRGSERIVVERESPLAHRSFPPTPGVYVRPFVLEVRWT